MENNFYVYIYLDPRKQGKYIYGDLKFDYEPFYVGKGKDKRMYIHLFECCKRKSIIRYNKIRKIRENGLEPIVSKLYDNLDENESFLLEKDIIKKIGRKDLNNGPLINLSDGGEGESGYIFTQEHRDKLSKSLKNSKIFQEAVRSEEKRKKTGESLKKFYETNIHNSTGRPKTNEEVEKIKEAMSLVFKIKDPNEEILNFRGTKEVSNYFKNLNERLGLTSRFKISSDAILYGKGSKGYYLIEKLNEYRDMKWGEERRENLSKQSYGKNNNSCRYTIECPDGLLKEFIGREELKLYFNELNNMHIGRNRISYETIINKGENKGYKLIKKEKIYKIS